MNLLIESCVYETVQSLCRPNSVSNDETYSLIMSQLEISRHFSWLTKSNFLFGWRNCQYVKKHSGWFQKPQANPSILCHWQTVGHSCKPCKGIYRTTSRSCTSSNELPTHTPNGILLAYWTATGNSLSMSLWTIYGWIHDCITSMSF